MIKSRALLSLEGVLGLILVSLFGAFLLPHFAYAEAVPVSDPSAIVSLLDAGAEVILESDIIMTERINVNAESSIDLNGHTLDLGNSAIYTFGGLTVLDSSEGKTGVLTGSATFTVNVGTTSQPGSMTLESGTIQCGGSYCISNAGNLTINGGYVVGKNYVVYSRENSLTTMNGGLMKILNGGDAIILSKPGSGFEMNGGKIDASFDDGTSDGAAGVGAFKDTTVVINGGEIVASSFAVYSNGGSGDNAKITVTGGVLSSVKTSAVYMPQKNGENVISGGTLIGLSGVEVRAGSLTISGGTFVGSMDIYEVIPATNGPTTDGAAVAVAQHDTLQPIDLMITGGTFEARVPLSYTNPLNNSDEDLAKISILVTGGVFNTDSGTPIINVAGTRILAGGIFANPVTEFVMDGYGEVLLEGTAVEVTPIRYISVEEDSAEFITIATSAPYKSIVNFEVKSDSELKKIVEVTDGNGTRIKVDSDSFIMPNSNVTVQVLDDELIPVPDTGAYTRKNDYVATVVSVLAGIAFASVPVYFIITRIKIRKAKVTFTKR